jgi:RNA polymerase primary sigma factor
MGDQINKLLRTAHRLTQKLGREPTTEELAAALEIPTRKAEEMLRVARRPLSLEMPTDDDGDSELGDFIEDEDISAPDEEVTFSMLRELLRGVRQIEAQALSRLRHPTHSRRLKDFLEK